MTDALTSVEERIPMKKIALPLVVMQYAGCMYPVSQLLVKKAVVFLLLSLCVSVAYAWVCVCGYDNPDRFQQCQNCSQPYVKSEGAANLNLNSGARVSARINVVGAQPEIYPCPPL